MISRTRLAKANAHAKRRWNGLYALKGFPYVSDHKDHTIDMILEPWQHYRKVTAKCSGICCGNPRKWFRKRTKQERVADEKQRELAREEVSGAGAG